MKKIIVILLSCTVSFNIFSKEVSLGFLAEYANSNHYRSYVEEDPNFDIYFRVLYESGLVLSIHQLNYASTWLYRYDYNQDGSLVSGGYTYEDEPSDYRYHYGYSDVFMTDLSIGRYTSVWGNRVQIITQAGPTLIIPGSTIIGFKEDGLLLADMDPKYQDNIKNIQNSLTLVDYFGLNLSVEVSYRFGFISMVTGVKYFTPLKQLENPDIGNLSLYVGPAISF